MEELKDAEVANARLDTVLHIREVNKNIHCIVTELIKRADNHDKTKLESPEVELFNKFTKNLSSYTYGTEEYAEQKRRDLKPALDHHYAKNRHHPEFFQLQEEWRDIIGYEGYYQVSNFGNVRSLNRINKRSTNGDVKKEGKIMKPIITPKNYLRLQLIKDGKYKHYFVHTLVAENFLKLPENPRMQVNHKNHNPQDNRVENLEWVTPSQNVQHSYMRNGRKSTARYIITCNELDITTIGIDKMVEKLRELGYNASSGNISRCINGNLQTHLDLTFTSENIQEPLEYSYVDNMNLIDLVELLCDWKASTKRSKNGDIKKSLVFNEHRFRICSQLTKIFENTIEVLDR